MSHLLDVARVRNVVCSLTQLTKMKVRTTIIHFDGSNIRLIYIEDEQPLVFQQIAKKQCAPCANVPHSPLRLAMLADGFCGRPPPTSDPHLHLMNRLSLVLTAPADYVSTLSRRFFCSHVDWRWSRPIIICIRQPAATLRRSRAGSQQQAASRWPWAAAGRYGGVRHCSRLPGSVRALRRCRLSTLLSRPPPPCR